MNTSITHHTNQTTRQGMVTQSFKKDVRCFDGYDFPQICFINGVNGVLDNSLDQYELDSCLLVTAIYEEFPLIKPNDMMKKFVRNKPCFQG